MNSQRSRLGWIVRNRQVRSSAVRIGDCIRDFTEGLPVREAVRAAVACYVDEEFRLLCEVGQVTTGVVELLVETPAASEALRLRWHTTLRDHLVRTCPGFGARRLVFRLREGTRGIGQGAEEAARIARGAVGGGLA